MFGLGTIVNTAAVIAGSLVGILLKRSINERISSSLMKAIGCATIFIGASGALSEMLAVTDSGISTQGIMLLCVSLALGTVVGELLKIEEKLESMGDRMKRMKIFASSSGNFTEGFVSATLVVCIGAMAIIGPIKDALEGDTSILFTKSILDFMSTMIFASTLGVGVMCSAIPMFIYQGAFTLFAGAVEPYLYSLGDGNLVGNLSMVGSVLIFGVGVNLAFGKKLRVGNMLPALLVPVLYAAGQSLLAFVK
ncbi:MAG: DUF554 domain-containing protein [Clostridia bacterium]|nr:DUF554 domain-containing protein [Clostridia bacterium]